MSLLTFESISKSYGGPPILSGLDLSVEEGEFFVLFGASASGKSVLLTMLVGLQAPDAGTIRLRGVDAASVRPGARRLGYVPQSFALFPNRSVRDNIAYPLTIAKESKSTIETAVGKMADLLDIGGLLDRTPGQLSGGQKQRVAIARGLVRSTELYVLDDPLVGLDFKLRERLVDDLRNTREALGATFLYATSDAGEALALGSTVAVLAGGKVCEQGAPYELYRNPRRLETMMSLCVPPSNRV
ncbi:MAG: ABC transporter ATP-binding protein, partial [Aeromicrobium sp.]